MGAAETTGVGNPEEARPGGKRHALAFQPHFGGRPRKHPVVNEPYTAANPCKVKCSGQGPTYLGFFQRPDTPRRSHKPKGRGPRCRMPIELDTSCTQTARTLAARTLFIAIHLYCDNIAQTNMRNMLQKQSPCN